MARTNIVSSFAVLHQFTRRFRPSGDGWVSDAIEDIGAALNIMHMHGAMMQTVCEITITGYRGKLPCNAEAIDYFEYENCYLPITHKNRVPGNGTLDPHVIAHGTINGPWLRTNFETGTVIVHYEIYPVDEKGFPMIHDSQLLFEALIWYIGRNYLMAGYTHPIITFPYADAMWEKAWPRAQNDVNFPSTQNAERFQYMWNTLIPNTTYQYKAYMETVGNPDNSNIEDFTEPSISN